MEQEVKQINQIPLESQLQQLSPHTLVLDKKIDADLVKQYQNFFSEHIHEQLMKKISKINITKLLYNSGIFYHPSQNKGQGLILNRLTSSINSQVIIFEAQWKSFTMKLSILNVAGKSQLHGNDCGMGANGCIYRAHLLQKDFIMKCLPFERQSSIDEAIHMAIKQYFLLKIAAALEIGPSIQDLSGFDIIIYEDCVQFAIERCDFLEQINDNIQEQLIQSLLLMHKLNVIHFDIKPENIMLSRQFSKPVFIDYGLSDLVDIQVGQRMEIFFKGTLYACSSEMMATFSSKCILPVDVYYNDLFCLKASFNSISKAASDKSSNKEGANDMYFQRQTKKQAIKSKLLLYLVKYYLFNNNMPALQMIMKEKRTEINYYFGGEILDFLLQNSPSKQRAQFYKFYIDSYQKDGYFYYGLKEMYKSVFMYFKDIPVNQQKQSIYLSSYQNLKYLSTNTGLKKLNEDEIFDLFTQKQQKIIEDQIFKIYVSFISFTNNIYHNDMKKRRQITQLLLKNEQIDIKIDENILEFHELSTLQMISKTIAAIFMKTVVKLANKVIFRWQKQLCFDLIELMFVLDIFDGKQLLEKIQLLYKQSFISGDRLQLILKIMHFNYWLLFRLKSKHKENLHNRYDKIRDWCFKKLNELCISENNEIANFLIQNWNQQIYSVPSPTQFNFLQSQSAEMKTELTMQIYGKLMIAKSSNVNDCLNQIYCSVSNGHKSHFYFYMFNLMHIYGVRYQNSLEIYKLMFILQKNLQCQEISEELIVSFLLHLIVKIDLNSDSMHLPLIQTFFNHADLTLLLKQSQFIMVLLKNASGYFVNQKQQYNRARKKLKQLVSMLNFHELVDIWYNDAEHKCLSLDLISNLFQIKHLYYNYVIQQFYTQDIIVDTTALIQKIKNKSNCHICLQIAEFASKRTLILFYIDNYRSFYTDQMDRKNFFLQFMANWSQIQQKDMGQLLKDKEISDIRTDQQFRINLQVAEFKHFSISQMCLMDANVEQKEQVVLFFYDFLVYFDRISLLFEQSLNNKSNKVKQILYIIYKNRSLKQVADYLTRLTAFHTIHRIPIFYDVIVTAITEFFNKYKLTIDFMEIYRFINERKYINSINPPLKNSLNAVFYHQIIPYLPKHMIMFSRWKLVNLFDELLPSVRRIFQLNYYLALLTQQANYGLFKVRKDDLIANYTLKIINILGPVYCQPLNIKQKVKYNTLKCRKLIQKGEKIIGPYNLSKHYLLHCFTIKKKR